MDNNLRPQNSSNLRTLPLNKGKSSLKNSPEKVLSFKDNTDRDFHNNMSVNLNFEGPPSIYNSKSSFVPQHHQSEMKTSHSIPNISLNRRQSERPQSIRSGLAQVASTATIKSPNQKFDFVCTSEACFRIKKKLNSTAFGKNIKKPIETAQKATSQEQQQTFESQQSVRMAVSPNMMIKKTKSVKEIKMEKKIKELFDNDPLFQLRRSIEQRPSQQLRKSILVPHSLQMSNEVFLSKLLSDFNVPARKFAILQNDEQREEFLIEHITTYMKNLKDQGLYAWLQVMTPHTSLHKKLRKALIEKFQSEDINPLEKESKMPLGFIGELSLQNRNQVLIDSSKALRSGAALSTLIENTFDDFVQTCLHEIDQERINGQKRPSFWDYNKTTAETIKLINAKNVDKLKPMHKGAKKIKRPQTAIGVLQRQNTASGVVGETHRSNASVGVNENGGMSKGAQTLDRVQSQKLLSPQMKKFLKKSQEASDKNKKLNWSEMYETRFAQHKNEMRIRLADLSSTNSWNQVVLGSFIKLFTKKPKVQEKNLIEEYKGLNYQKVKKVVSSIPSLNECIDKEYFQSIIDRMNPKKIEHVETHISNQVILQYEREKEKSKNARFKFLKRKADIKGQVIKQHDQQMAKKEQSVQNFEENKQMAKRFKVVLKGLDKGLVSLRSQKEHQELQKFHNPKKKGLPEPLILPVDQTEAYRNKAIYDYFKDCPDKPKFKHDGQSEYFWTTTTGGPIRQVKKEKVITNEQLAHAVLKIQRAIKRWRFRKLIQQEKARLKEIQKASAHQTCQNSHQQSQMNRKSSFFMTQPNQHLRDKIFNNKQTPQRLSKDSVSSSLTQSDEDEESVNIDEYFNKTKKQVTIFDQ